MHSLLIALAALVYFVLAAIIAELSGRVIRNGELGTLRSWLLFPLSNVKGKSNLSVAYYFFSLNPSENSSPTQELQDEEYTSFTFALLPIRVPWIVIVGGTAICARFLRAALIRRSMRRSLDIDADLVTAKMLAERMKLGEERRLLQSQLSEVEQRISELGALLDEPQSGVFRGAPRSAKSQAT